MVTRSDETSLDSPDGRAYGGTVTRAIGSTNGRANNRTDATLYGVQSSDEGSNPQPIKVADQCANSYQGANKRAHGSADMGADGRSIERSNKVANAKTLLQRERPQW
jgi:hypothetical protein